MGRKIVEKPIRGLTDDQARRAAILDHHRSILVEAGAGSGKTSVMAGRIAMMLANGITPKSIAAVTFTELAASELLSRVRAFVHALSAGTIPAELRLAIPNGLDAVQRQHISAAEALIDDITCSTIHGFCQRLILPYPVEADIDPGAAVMDRAQAELAFYEITDSWLREQLSGAEGSLIAELVFYDPSRTVALIGDILSQLRKRRSLRAKPASPLPPLIADFQREAALFMQFIEQTKAQEPETTLIAKQFAEMSKSLQGLGGRSPAELVRLLTCEAHPGLCTQAGAFRSFAKAGKWRAAAKLAGLSKADGEVLKDLAAEHYQNCCTAWTTLLEATATTVLADLVDAVRPVLAEFRNYKRSAALLDFDDLIYAARDLLRDHDNVRRALAERFRHVLVDEFQDTDPLQTEIFWRLCGESGPDAAAEAWPAFLIRPGALFLVGDPKQAIYRFRGADVQAYVSARTAFIAQDPASNLSISTNFRSRESILKYVNVRFEALLSAPAQPGFTPLNPFHFDRAEALHVAALDVAVVIQSAEGQRDAEADAVAAMCARLIGQDVVMNETTRELRPCRPGDIALLAPTGSDLWRYEEALERHNIPVATQAGKGLFRRQEIQDLIALTRVLADRRDTLALGALLRGPLAGLTEEELLDIIWSLRSADDPPEELPRLDLNTDPATIPHALAKDILEKLQSVARRANSTTPHALLSQAIDVLRVRPLLLERHRGQAERALANVDLFLSLSSAYAIRGLRAFAEMVTAAWEDETRAVEGRPDAQEEAVALFTIHSAKGLEWPIVIPINTMTGTKSPSGAIVDRVHNHLYCPVLGVQPDGHDQVRNAEKEELTRERVRLWYVASTRAQELLILPRLDSPAPANAWISLVNLDLGKLPALSLDNLPMPVPAMAAQPQNNQTREIFAREAAMIAGLAHDIIWVAPSRDEGIGKPLMQTESAEISFSGFGSASAALEVQGGLNRGLIIHKLFEEVLSGETKASPRELEERAATLIGELGAIPTDNSALGLSPVELASCITRTLALPEIVALRPGLVPEFPVYESTNSEGAERAISGIADAVLYGVDGRPDVIIDWKSDVAPAPGTIEHYQSQLFQYLQIMRARQGYIVFVTTGRILSVKARVLE
jgi:exodeoxyribonuclease-5